MPEAFAVLGVLVVAVAAWLGAFIRARDPALQNPAEDLQRMRQHADWLEQRLHLARRERWDETMIASLETELRTTAQQLARR